MPYVFAALILLNAAAFGYFAFMQDDNVAIEASIAEAESQITQPITFTNTSKDVPPLIGTAD